MKENDYWKVCAALDCERRLSLVGFLLSAETTEFPSVCELAERFKVSEPSMSVHLKTLATAGLVTSKRAERRVFYRAFPTTEAGARTLLALRDFFLQRPDAQRVRRLLDYVHALSHHRRNAIVRCLSAEPGLSVKELSHRTEMPPQTADRLWGQLGKARIVDLRGTVVPPVRQPEAVFLELTIGKPVSHL